VTAAGSGQWAETRGWGDAAAIQPPHLTASAGVATVREPGRVSQIWSPAARWLSPVFFGLMIFALALGPRWMARDVFMTSDEDSWMRRAGGFAYGVSHGLLGRTYQNGHPGVLTMELAILGQGPGGAERFADPVTGVRMVTKVPGFFEGLVQARRAFALAGAALVTMIALLTWRLLGPGPAVISGVLLALDPFMIAHSQLVHTDGLLAGLTASAALCGLIRWVRGAGLRWIVLGGVLTGLAFLAKVPAIYLGMSVPLLALGLGRWRGARLAIDLGVWGLSALATVVLLWPSLWVNSVSTITRMLEFARETGGQPDEVGSYFLGQVWGDPGPLFYPVALAFRLTPAATIGLLLFGGLAWPMRRLLRAHGRALLGLAAYGLGFLLFVTVAQKKFDRYALPVIPVLLLFGGLGWWLLYRRLRPFMAGGPPRLVAAMCLAVLALFQWSASGSVYPYYMSYFNPLLGGGPAAAQMVMVGNGEGMDQVAEYFNQLPSPEDLWIASHSFDLLEATCRCDGEPLRERAPSDADYIVVYGRRIQLRRWAPSLEQYLQDREPVHRVWINGIEMARIYPGPHSLAR
jgi:hypothetical protein